MSNIDFWDDLLNSYVGDASDDFAGNYLTASEKEAQEEIQRVEYAVERRLIGKSVRDDSFTSVRDLTTYGSSALTMPVVAGTRVQFTNTAEAVLSYEDPPAPNMSGVVVTVKSASGMITSHDGSVFVRWADDKVRAIYAEHLRPSKASMRVNAKAQNKIRVARLGDLTEFLRMAGTDDTLIHKATKDLWHVKSDGDAFVIERLFDDTGAPLRV